MSAKVRLGLLACGPCRRPPQIPLRLLRRDTSQCIDHHEPYNILEQQHSGISRKFKSDDSRTFKCLNLYSTCIVRKCVRVCVCHCQYDQTMSFLRQCFGMLRPKSVKHITKPPHFVPVHLNNLSGFRPAGPVASNSPIDHTQHLELLCTLLLRVQQTMRV